MELSSRESGDSESAASERNTNVSEARIVGRFAWAEAMLKEAEAFLDQGDLETYLARRETVERELNMLADDMALPQNKTPEREWIQERWLKEDEKILTVIEKLDEKAKQLASAQGKPKEVIRGEKS